MTLEWSTRLLANLADIVMGQAPPAAAVRDDLSFGLPFIQGNAEFGARNPAPRKSCPTPSKIAEPGDILISVRAPVGALNLARERLGIGRGLAAIRSRGIFGDFAWYAIQHRVGDLRRVSQGSTFEAVNKDALGSLSLPIPPVSEQRKIAAILSSVDDAIEATQAIIDQLGVVKKAMMAELTAKSEMLQWPRRTVGNLISELGGEVRTGPFGTVLRAEEQNSNGIPLVSVREIRDGFIAVVAATPRVP